MARGMMRNSLGGLLLYALASNAALTNDQLRPVYHFTRAEGEMNDPNGLLWRRGPSTADGTPGPVTYHLFYQSDNPVGPSHGWGHGRSPDLLHWERLPRLGADGSSGGGVQLPDGFSHGWTAALTMSVPVFPPRNPPTGIHLWTASDAALSKFTEYRDPVRVQNSTNETCVICPETVPRDVRAAYIGDNYLWRGLGDDKDTFFFLAGSGRCPDNATEWCGYNTDANQPLAMLFTSKDLINWRYRSQFYFYKNHDMGNRVDTPDTWELPDGRQAFVWLGNLETRWSVGKLDPETLVFTPGNAGASPADFGVYDVGDMFCQQSLWDAQGRRVSIAWIRLFLPNATYSGAQSLPRVVTAVDQAKGGGLVFEFAPEVATLHLPGPENQLAYPKVALSPSRRFPIAQLGADVEFATRAHVEVTVRELAANSTLTASLLGGAFAVHLSSRCEGGCFELQIDGSTDFGALPAKLEPALATLPLMVDVFVDGAVLEAYAAGRVISRVATGANSTDAVFSVAGSDSARADIGIQIWKMASTVKGP